MAVVGCGQSGVHGVWSVCGDVRWPVCCETCVGWQGWGVIFVDCGRCVVWPVWPVASVWPVWMWTVWDVPV
jgi:hypothetical protein